MRIRTLSSAGKRVSKPFEIIIVDTDGAPYEPEVAITVEPLSRAEMVALRDECTHAKPNPVTGGTRSVFDGTEYELAYYTRVIKSWRGIESNEGDPVTEITADAVAEVLMNGHIKAQLDARCLSTEAADPAESFRESQGVVPVVDGRGVTNSVLSEGHGRRGRRTA